MCKIDQAGREKDESDCRFWRDVYYFKKLIHSHMLRFDVFNHNDRLQRLTQVTCTVWHYTHIILDLILNLNTVYSVNIQKIVRYVKGEALKLTIF